MENKAYLGIDPGSKGFLSLQHDGNFEFYSIADNDLYQLSKIMNEIRSNNINLVCIIEDVKAIFGSSAKATFSFGFNKGYLIGLLAASRIPYVLVQPKIWQKEVWGNSDMVLTYKEVTLRGKKTIRKEVNTKATSINCCKRLFPMIDLRKTAKCKNPDDNKCDSMLMSEYGRRKNL